MQQNRFDYHGTILGNIYWNVNRPLEDSESIARDENVIYELNDTYIQPVTHSIRITNMPLGRDYVMTVPNTWPHGINYWQILSGFDTYFRKIFDPAQNGGKLEPLGNHIRWEGLTYAQQDLDGTRIYHLHLGS